MEWGTVRRENRDNDAQLSFPPTTSEDAHLTDTLHEEPREYLEGEKQVYPLATGAGILIRLMC